MPTTGIFFIFLYFMFIFYECKTPFMAHLPYVSMKMAHIGPTYLGKKQRADLMRRPVGGSGRKGANLSQTRVL